MKLARRSLTWIVGLSVCLVGTAAEKPAAFSDALEKRAAVIKPSAEELRWQRIPWLLDLAEGERLARQEDRPIFLWVTGDDPLERC